MTDKNTILIVDDQESIIKSLKRLLLSEPYDILSAQDGESAIKVIREQIENNKERQNTIFLIISDQRMPNMTGTQLLEKTMDMLPDAIRFILSGYADRDDIINSLNKGVTHRYITKPWNNEELLIMIRQAQEFPEKVRRFIDARVAESKLPEINIMDRELKQFDEHRKDMFLGRVAVHHGFITQEQLSLSITNLQSERQAGRNISLENILFEKGLISSEDMGKIIAVTRRRMGKTFAKTAMQSFGISQADIEKGLAIQAQEFSNTSTCRLLGDILVSEKIITEEQKESIIIDQIYSEREMIASDRSELSVSQNGDIENPNKNDVKHENLRNELILRRKKKNFFRQRALDKIFCKSAINRNFATEAEILKALEEQLIHFTRTFQIKLIKDILIARSIISQSQAQTILDAISSPQQPVVEKTSKHLNADLTSDSIQPDNKIETDKLETNKIETDKIETDKIETDKIKTEKIKTEKIKTDNKEPFEINIAEDELQATVHLTGDLPEGMNAERLKEFVSSKDRIIYGLADDVAIEMFLRQASAKKEESFVIARGKAAIYGRNGAIKYLFESESARFGKELDSGKFDYRERGEIPNILKGTVLAEKIPPIPAINGITVRGIEIVAPIPIDVTLDCGQGVELSNDGLRAIASVNGRPDITLTGKISVLPEKIIKGNVDFRTGNIKFSGDIIVHGTILAGFSVIGGNLTVNDIEEAEVNITNTISVKNNINASTVRTGVLLTAQIIKKSTVIAQGDVVVQKEIIDSTIITSGRVIVPRGRIMASRIHAAKGIEAMNIGSEVSTPCHLFPGSDEHAKSIIGAFSEKIDHHKESLAKLEAVKRKYDIQSLKQLNELTELSRLQERLSVEKIKTIEDRKVVSSQIVIKQLDDFLADLDKRALKMDETINKLFDENDIIQTKTTEIKAKIKAVSGEMENLINEKSKFETWYDSQKKEAAQKGIYVMVQGTLFSGTIITAPECTMTVKSHIKNSNLLQQMKVNEAGNQYYEMAAIPLSSKNKPHVYRT